MEGRGDLRVLGAIEKVGGGGVVAVPLSGPAARVGGTIKMARPGAQTLRLGQPAQLMLLKPLEETSTYRIERIIRFDR